MLLYIESIWVNDIDGIELVIRGLGLHHHAGKFSSSCFPVSLRLLGQSDAMPNEVLHLPRMQTWRSGAPKCNSQEIYSLTSKGSDWDVPGASRDMHFWRSFSNVPCLPQNPHASLALPRCRIHCASHARPHPNFKECSETTSFNVCDLRMCFVPQGCWWFQHLNLIAQRSWGVTRLFAFKNDFRATALCAFSTCQCPFTF